MAKDILTITQCDVNGADVKIALVDNQELRIERKKAFSTDEYRINVLVLNDKSKRKITFGWKWFIAGLITCLLLIPKSIHMLIIPSLYIDVAFYAGIILSIYCFFMAWETTRFRQFFYSLSTNVPIVELAVGKPTAKEFEEFVKKTEESIQTYREEMDLDPYKQRKGEIKTLRRLNEMGIISEPDYEDSKSVLLSQM